MFSYKSLATAVALASAIVSAPAGAQEKAAPHDMKAPMPTATQSQMQGDATGKMSGGMAADAVALTGDPDVDFARMMLPHHEGAVAMAESLLETGKDPELRRMAEEVIAAQSTEIEFLNAWLAKNDSR